MPRIDDLDSDEDMSGVELELEQATPPPLAEKPFTSKADLMSGMVDNDILDYDFDEDSDDSDLEIYGKVKPSAEQVRSRSIADTNDEESINEGELEQGLRSPFMLGRERGESDTLYQGGNELKNRTPGIQDPEDEDGEESWLEQGEEDDSAQVETKTTSEKKETGNRIKREDDVSIKSEDDTESIHYGEGADEENSTINVQPSTEPSPSIAQTRNGLGATHRGGHDDLPWLADAPVEVQARLTKWFDVHGRVPPLCAGWPSPQYMRVGTTGKPAIWLHTSGERLEPSMYQIPDLIEKQQVPTRRILVLQGKTRGPYIAAVTTAGHASSDAWEGWPDGCHGGTRYRIWLGVESPDADGFEPRRTSIWKGFAHNLRDNSISSTQMDPSTIKSLKPSGAQVAVHKGKVSALAESIPEQLKSQLEAWMAKHGRSYPPCAYQFPERLLHHSNSGAVATWWHESGEQLQPRGYTVDALVENSQKRILVLQGASRGPYIVRYHKAYNNNEAIGYKIWEGVNGGELGFERGCSTFKYLGSVRPTRENIKRWQSGLKHKQVHPKNGPKPSLSHHTPAHWASKTDGKLDDQATLRPRSSIAKPSKYVPTKTSEYKRADYPQKPATKRKRDEYDDEDRESLLNSFMSPAAEKLPKPLNVSSQELVDHIKNNVVLLFFPHSAGAPRVRLLGSCDSVQKLFAQALAGDVFADSGGSGTKVLALTFGGGQNKSRSLVEDDDQDFDDLLNALKALDCWVMEDGVLQGSLTVEVRAK